MRRRRIPTPLAALLAAVLITGIAWTLVIPPFQHPDETGHLARTQRMAEGVPSQPFYSNGKVWSSDEELAVYTQDALWVYGNVLAKPSWDPALDGRYRTAADKVTDAQRRDISGSGVADNNPAAYYVFAGLPYRLGGDLVTRLWTIRLFGVLWLLVTVVGAWLLAGEVFRDRRLQTVAAGFAGLQPMVDSISSAVSPDGMLIACSTLSLWLTVRVLRRGLSAPALLGLLAAVVLACLVKTSAFALVPGALVAVAVAVLRRRRPDLRLSPRRLAVGAAATVAGLAVLLVLLRTVGTAIAPQLATPLSGIDSPREFASYLVQFYFGPQSSLTPTPNLGGADRFDVNWIRQAWGLFGQLDTAMPDIVYSLAFWLGWVVLALAGVAVVRRRKAGDLAVAGVLVLALLVTVGALHVIEYRNLVAGGLPFIQGRYLLPLIGLGSVIVAAAVASFPPRWRGPAAGLVLGAMVALQLVALESAAVRYFAA